MIKPWKIVIFYRKVLADLAIWEPQTFEAIVRIGRERAVNDNIDGVKERSSTDNRVYLNDKSGGSH